MTTLNNIIMIIVLNFLNIWVYIKYKILLTKYCVYSTPRFSIIKTTSKYTTKVSK